MAAARPYFFNESRTTWRTPTRDFCSDLNRLESSQKKTSQSPCFEQPRVTYWVTRGLETGVGGIVEEVGWAAGGGGIRFGERNEVIKAVLFKRKSIKCVAIGGG